MKVIHFPSDQGTNPYQRSLINGLRECGAEVRAVLDGDISFARIAFFDDADILHLHWMHSKITARSLPIALIRFVIMHLSLVVWRMRGKQIVWTVHQLQNHEGKRLWLDRLNSRLIAWWASRIIVHGPSAIPLVRDALGVPDHKLSVIFHQSYRTVLEAARPPSGENLRRKFLFFGQIRAYKGVPKLIRTLRALELDVDLLVCGNPYDDAMHAELEAAAETASSVQLDLRFVSDETLQAALVNCDVVVLPFDDVFTSGSLVMALCAARPVVAPRAGILCDYVDDDCAFLYDPTGSNGLSDALSRAAHDKELQQKGEAARQRALLLAPEKIAEQLCELYRELIA